MKQYIYSLLFVVTVIVASCTPDNDVKTNIKGKSIVILYENDVHCAVDGYAKIAGLRNAINQTDTAECIIVSGGDYFQGGSWGALSRGYYIVDLMNAVGYSAATIGNHELDYGTPRLMELVGKSNTPRTCVNFCKANSKEPLFDPYLIVNVSGKRVAFVGVLTPEALTDEFYAFYDSEGKQVYDLCPDDYVSMTQSAVDDARMAGADYVVLLSHLGEYGEYLSNNLIASTHGIDIVFDAHSHSVIPFSSTANKDGVQIPLTQTGTQFENIGKLVITASGKMSTELLPLTDVAYSDNHVKAVRDSIETLISGVIGEVLGISDHELSIHDSDGKRIVRNAEATMGNFCADAYRYCMHTEIGLVNGGGVRKGLPSGEIKYGDMIDVNPFFNDLESRELTGGQLRQMLTESYGMIPNENGSFLQVSGLRIEVSLDNGIPKVCDVQVEDKATCQYQPLDDSRKYSVAASSHVFSCFPFLKEREIVTPVIMKDTEALKIYFVEFLKGNMRTQYTTTEGRILVRS